MQIQKGSAFFLFTSVPYCGHCLYFFCIFIDYKICTIKHEKILSKCLKRNSGFKFICPYSPFGFWCIDDSLPWLCQADRIQRAQRSIYGFPGLGKYGIFEFGHICRAVLFHPFDIRIIHAPCQHSLINHHASRPFGT